ncbi:MAG: 2-dehydro-3-deoxyphosphogluconate aldolase / (4S)-4-hydroxy-2-oxoglutarate aldolase [Verrucomicrobia bacterium]|nr:MAG: 2-dehydro-3-deoxyphosphogluconate aldolase / (4S)-4-hydroxy-2-oxoglutarate aldolase [Verrucomicrobiota bacterium]
MIKLSIIRHRVVPVAVVDDAADAVPLARALARGGLPVLELTLRTPGALGGIANIRRECPEILVGAGTILTPVQVGEVIQAGAQFGLSPGINPAVVKAALEQGLFFIPGVMTPSDVEAALQLECRLLKFFPAVPAGGTAMLQALNSPFGHTGVEFVPLGGVSAQNMQDYLRLGCVPAVGGSWICERTLVREKRWGEITALAAEAVGLAAQLFSEEATPTTL